jgi:hypothetical protein
MSSFGASHFIDPLCLALIVRKAEVISLDQLPLVFNALGVSVHGLNRRVRATLDSLIKRADAPIQLLDLYAHPGAISMWGRVWTTADKKTTGGSDGVVYAIEHNWRHITNCCPMKILCHRSKRGLLKRLKQSADASQLTSGGKSLEVIDDAAAITARLLRTSVWIDLLKCAPDAARSWRVFGRPHKDPFRHLVSATYRNSSGKRVWAVFPEYYCLDKEEMNLCCDHLRDIYKVAKRKQWIVEVYSLQFPSRPWPGSESKYDKLQEERVNKSYEDFARALAEADVVIRQLLS